jgi:hypothetical protein
MHVYTVVFFVVELGFSKPSYFGIRQLATPLYQSRSGSCAKPASRKSKLSVSSIQFKKKTLDEGSGLCTAQTHGRVWSRLFRGGRLN